MKKLITPLLEAVKSKENKNTLIYLGASIFSAFAGFIMLRYFTKYLGPEDIGIFGYVTAVNAFLLPFFSLNLETFYIKEVYNNSDEENRKKLLGSIVSFSVIWSVILTAFLTLTGSLVFRVLDIKFPFFPYMFLTLLSNLGLATFTYLLFQYRILGRAWSYFLITALQTVLLIGFGYFFVGFIHWQIYGRILGVFLGSLLLGIVCFFIIRRHLVWILNRDILRKALKFSLPLIPYSIATLLYDMLDRFFLERYSINMASTGIYNMGAQYAIILSMLSMAFYRAYEPTIFKMASEGNEKGINKAVIMLNNVLLLVAVPLICVSGWLINYLTHGKFTSSAYIASLLIVAFYFRSSYIMLNTVLTAMNRTKEIMWFSVIGLAIVIVLSLLLVPVYNNVGTALIKIFLYVGMFLTSFLVIRKSSVYKPYILHTLFTGIILIVIVSILKRMQLI